MSLNIDALRVVLEEAVRGATTGAQIDEKFQKLLIHPILNALSEYESNANGLVFMQWKAQAYDQSFYLSELMFGTIYLFEHLVNKLVEQEELHGWKGGIKQRLRIHWHECDLTPYEMRNVVMRVPDTWMQDSQVNLLCQLYPPYRRCYYNLLKPYLIGDLQELVLDYLVCPMPPIQ